MAGTVLLLAALGLLQEPADLIERLAADSIETRDKAVADLIAMGLRALPAAREALAGAADPELRRRLTTVLDTIDRPTFARMANLAAGEWRWIDAAWSPDGDVLALVKDQQEVVLLSADTLEERRRRCVERAREVAFSPSGPFLAAQGARLEFLTPADLSCRQREDV